MIFGKKEYIFCKDIESITVLGLPGCGSCEILFRNVKEALKEMGADTEPVYINDIDKVRSYGVMSVPALLINGKIVSAGKSLSVKKLKDIFSQKI